MFVFYADTLFRRQALALPPRRVQRYCLYGYDQLLERGWEVKHNLGAGQQPGFAVRYAAHCIDRTLWALGGGSGDFLSVLHHRKAANESDIVMATVDSLGIPLALLKGVGLLRPPMVYVSIGLPERVLNGFRSPRMRLIFRRLFRKVDQWVAYGWEEAQWLRAWLGLDPDHARVRFVPFGVDTEYFQPRDVPPQCDVLSIGADPQRDYSLLLETARRNPAVRVRIVTNADHAGRLAEEGLENIEIVQDVPFEQLRDLYATARIIVLPVRENTYSGATTTLLQALAMAKPVVVSRVGAIRGGYGFQDRVHLRWAEPGDADSLEQAVLDLLAQPEEAVVMGGRAREHVVANLTWDHYVERMSDVFKAAGKDGDFSTRKSRKGQEG